MTRTIALGAVPGPDGVLFRVWAPHAQRVELILERDGAGDGNGSPRPLSPRPGGYFELAIGQARAGALYRYRLDGGAAMPDPASRFQPHGVHGASQVVDPSSHDWKDASWRGVPQHELAFYELHVGAFTAAGNLGAVADKLPYLKDLGVTAVQLMPVSDFPGRWNWGYDPAALYAPTRAYGSPDDLRRLVDAAHGMGLAVFLDVIYNHFGPDGAYAPAYAPFHTTRHQTPWGQGINLDGEHSDGVRNFFIDNAIHWLREYHVDGLRLDAIFAMKDDSEVPFLAQLADAIAALPGPKRTLVAEDERNQRAVIEPRDTGGLGIDAVWADDFHHQVQNMTAGDQWSYYQDYAGTRAADLAATLRQGWFFTGQISRHHGRARGTDPTGLPPARFVFCIQNHDQVGNRPTGDRLHHQISPPVYRAVTALLLFAPQLPLLFMGQEWGTSSPFQFFTDHEPELGRNVQNGRRRQFASYPGFAERVCDPQDPETFGRSRLRWDEQTLPDGQRLLTLYRDLLTLRRSLAGRFSAHAHGQWGLTLQRGRHHLLVALKPEVRIPIPPDATLTLHTEQPAYAAPGRPPIVNAGHLVFVEAGAAVLKAG